MSRHPTLLVKLRRDVRDQRGQFAALLIMVLLGVALFAATYDAYQNLRASYAELFEQERFADLFVTGGDIEAYAAEAAASQAVAATATRTQTDLGFSVGADKLRGRIIGYPLTDEPPVNRLTLLQGSGLADQSSALVEHHMAEHFGLGPGDTVTVSGAAGLEDLTVVGVVSSAEYLWPARSRQEPITTPDDFGVVFTPEETARRLAGVAEPNQVLLRLTDTARGDGDAVEELAGLAAQSGADEVLTRDEQPSNSLLQMDIDGFEQMSVAFPVLFLTAAGLTTYVLLTRRVQAERSLIGMLRAQGMRRRTVAAHYLGYGVLAGLGGALLGLAVGLPAARLLSRLYIGVIDLPAQSTVLVTGRPVTVAGGLLFGLGVGALAALAPALAATRVPPAEAMRGEVPSAPGGLTLPERVIPPLRRLPARWQLVVRGAGRNRKRSIFTATGVAFSLILVLVSWTMYDTMRVLMDTQFAEVTRQDAQVDFAGAVGPDQLDSLRRIDGIADVEPLIQQPATVASAGATYATVLSGYQPGTGMHGFRLADGGFTGLPDDGILVGQAIEDMLGVAVGDDVALRLPASGQEVQATIVGFLDEPLGTFVYASSEWLTAEFGEILATSALLSFERGADRVEVRRAVSAEPGVVSYVDSRALQRLWDEYAGLFYVFIGGMLALGGLMAFAIIFTTMSANIVERRREVATLRAGGVRHGVLARIVARENMLIVLIGVLPGLALGIVAGDVFLSTYSSDQFHLDLVVVPTTLIVSSAAILIVAAISQWPGLRAIRRMDLAAAVRERGG